MMGKTVQLNFIRLLHTSMISCEDVSVVTGLSINLILLLHSLFIHNIPSISTDVISTGSLNIFITDHKLIYNIPNVYLFLGL